MAVLLGLTVAGCGSAGPVSDASSPAVAPTPTASSEPVPTPVPSSASPSPSPSPSAVRSTAPTPSAVTRTTYAAELTLSGDELSFQPLRWYWGAKAQQRCREKKVKSSFEWCNEYYYEKSGSVTRETVPRDVTVRLTGDGATPQRSTRRALVAALDEGSITYAKLTTTGDSVTAFEQVFVP